MPKLLALLLAAVVAPAAPAPSAAPTEKPLREIGHVRATTVFCQKMIETASETVDIALTDDVKLAGVVSALRVADLDTSQLSKAKVVSDLRERFASLRKSAVAAERAMKAFKAQAKTAPTPEERDALLKFADALAGAVTRQQRLADKIGGFIAYLDAHEPFTQDQRAEWQLNDAINASNANHNDPWYNPVGILPGDPSNIPPTLTMQAQQAADEIARRTDDINKDEDDAASRIDLAFSRC